MRIPLLLILGLSLPGAQGQLQPDVTAKLQSAHWQEREVAYKSLAQEKTRSPDEDTALVALLLKENAFRRQPEGAHPDPDDIDDGEFVQYTSSLSGTVQEIAEKNPERPDVWPALLGSAYGAPSDLTKFFAAHADKTASFFLAAANGNLPGPSMPDVLVALAQIVSYERDPAEHHHLSIADVQLIERTIRDRMYNPDIVTRMGAVDALGIIGNADDLKLLDEMAATDPTYDSDSKYYPLRVVARSAAEDLRRRLSQTKRTTLAR